MRRLFPDVGNGNARDEICDFLVGDSSCACPNDQATKPLRTPRRIIQSSETTAGDANQVKSVEREMIDQCVEIAGNASRLLT